MRRSTAAVAVTGLLLLTTACSSSSGKGSSPATPAKAGAAVRIPLLSFDPVSVTIKTGQTVTWTDANDITHVLVEGTYKVDGNGLRTSETDDKAFSLKLSKKGDVVSHTYDKAGTYTYYCTIHKGMNGTVTVQ